MPNKKYYMKVGIHVPYEAEDDVEADGFSPAREKRYLELFCWIESALNDYKPDFAPDYYEVWCENHEEEE